MKILIILAIVIFCIVLPFPKMLVMNFHRILLYGFTDSISFFINKKWNEFNLYGIDMFIGMFGHGKTLSMTNQARKIYEAYGDQVRFLSNYKLVDIPYIPLINFNQLVDLGEEEEDKYIGTVVLIDEIENVLSHRNFANFPLPMLHMLTQQRKKKVKIYCSAQRFFMVDKLFRSLTTNVFNCNKYWRFQHCEVYDAWDLEQAMNYENIKRIGNIWWFVRNKDYNSYDTSEMVKKNTAENFISNEESIVRRGLDSVVNNDAVVNHSRSYKKTHKK